MVKKLRPVYKNDELPSGTYTDLAGDEMTYYYGGELRLGDDAEYEGHQARNVDGTLTSMPAQDEVISTSLACYCCGYPVERRSELTIVDGKAKCRDCIDEPGAGE